MNRLAWLGAWAVAAIVTAAVAADITPVSMVESRSGALDPKATGVMGASAQLTVKVSGDDIKGATQFGKIKLAEAKDDTGKDISKGLFSFTTAQMNRINEFSVDKKDGSFTFTIPLDVSSRKAAKISLKGEVTILAGGEAKEAKLGKVMELYGKEVDDASLKAAGVSLKASAKGGNGDQGIAFEVTGPSEVISKIVYTDKEAKPLNSNYNLWLNQTTKKMMLNVIPYGKIDDATTLTITVMVGQKTLTAPFEFNDLTLP